jgi:DNA repair ATPase RecN
LDKNKSTYAKEKKEFCSSVVKEIEILKNKIGEAETLEKQIQDLKSSAFFMTEEKIKEAEKIILEARQINTKISFLERNPSLQQSTEEMKLMIEKAKEILRNLESTTEESSNEALNAVLQAQQDAREELKCVICLDVPRADTHVFSCLEQHLICATCKTNKG